MNMSWTLRTAFLLPVLFFSPQQGGLKEARLQLVSRNYEAAIRLLEKEYRSRIQDTEAKGKDRLLFLLANTRFLSGDIAAAEKDFKKLVDEYQDSSYRELASFGLARVFSKAHRFQEASEIYRSQVARLLSPKRRVDLSEAYLSLANKALVKEPVDYRSAISFIDLAVGLELPQERTRELAKRTAKLAFEAKDYAQAARRFAKIVREIRGEIFGKGNGNPAFDDRLWLARSWRLSKQVANARRTFEDLLREKIPGDGGPTALLELARCFGIPGRGSTRGVDLLQRFLDTWPEHDKAPQAAYLLSQTQARLGRHKEALASIELLLSKYADRDVDYLAQGSADKGQYLGILQDFDKAIFAWKSYLASYPAHKRWMSAQRAIVDLELARASAAQSEGKDEFPRAIRLYLAFTRNYPLDSRVSGLQLKIGGMHEERKDFEAAKRVYERCASKYQGRREASDAAFRVGRLLESKLFNYTAALAAYKKVTGVFRGQAQARLAMLQRKSLSLATERVFTSKEKPQIKVTSRNIQTLRVRVYKLELEAFFRGTLGLGSVEALAIEVISPDKSFESKINAYEAHRETERQIEIPFQGPGAYVVKVDDQDFEATTLVLVSDLALISKASRKELFVFAQNTVLNQPVKGARIIITDGKRILAEGKTDARGSYLFRDKRVETVQQLFVLAVTREGSAASTLPFAGLRVTQGLQAKAFIYTDRGMYRPGETVQVKVILRDVDRGRYILPKQKGHVLDWLDGAGRLLASRKLEVSEYGTLAAAFEVPAQAQPGSFVLRVRRLDDGQQLSTTTVFVRAFSPPRVAVKVVSEQRVLLRGEKIEGYVKARYFFGGPVRERKIEVRTRIGGQQRVLSGRTDKAGEFPFSFETENAQASEIVQLQVSIPEERASVVQTFYVRETAFSLALSLPSTIYLAGEDLEAKAIVRGHDGKFLMRELQFELFRLETSRGTVQELPVAKKKAQSSTKKGEAFASFELKKGGRYRLRVRAKDRFDHQILSQADFFVSGKEDEVKLRILSRVQHARVGQELALRIVNRTGPKLCLVTFEGDGVLGFETRVFPQGESIYRLHLDPDKAPNFRFALAMVDGNKLHLAAKDFLVDKPLDVEIKLSKKEIRPGEKLEIEIRAMDSEGKPVQAEFSLAAIDEALLQLMADNSPDLYEVFYGASVRRNTELRTKSSCTFSYKGRTSKVNQALKAEEAKKELDRLNERLRKSFASDDAEGLIMGRRGFNGRLAAMKNLDRPARTLALNEKQQRESRAFRQDLQTGQMWQSNKPGQSAGIFFDDGLGGDYRARTPNFLDTRLGSLMASSSRGLFPLSDFNIFSVSNEAGGDMSALIQQQAQTLSLGYLANERNRVANDPASNPSHGEQELAVLASDLAVWRANIRTDEHGKAKIEVTLPQRAGSFKIRLRGVSRTSLMGEAKASVVSTEELVVTTVLPSVMTEGDKPKALLRIHNLSEHKKQVEFEVKQDEDALGSGKKTVDARSNVTHALKLATDKPGLSRVIATARSGSQTVAKQESVFEVLPWALEERVGKSGAMSGELVITLKLPDGVKYRQQSLVIELGPEVLEALLLTGGYRGSRALNQCSSELLLIPDTHANRAGAGLAALVMLDHRSQVAPADRGMIAALRSQIEASVASIQSIEKNGQMAWIGKSSRFDSRASLMAWLFLERADKAGITVDQNVLSRFRSRQSAQQRSRDSELATLAFLCSAEAGRATFSRFNSLFRSRRGMGLSALGALAIGAQRMGRPELATELLTAIAKRLAVKFGPGSRLRDNRDLKRSVREAVQPLLWGLLALSCAKQRSDLMEAGERWIYRMRRPTGWTDSMATALALDFMARRLSSGAKLATGIEVEVNASYKSRIDLRKDRSQRRIFVPAAQLVDGENKIRIKTRGQGRIVWSATLSGLTVGMPLDRLGSRRLTRTYLQALPVMEGQILPEGFSKVDSKVKRWENLATAVETGGSIRARIRFYPTSEMRKGMGSYVLEEPLPAGCLVLKEEISGNFDHLEIWPGFLRFYVHESQGYVNVDYKLRGFLPGRYRVLPTRVYSIGKKGLVVYGKTAEIAVLSNDEKSPDKRRLSPDELYARGIKLFDRLDAASLTKNIAARDLAASFLDKLYTDFGKNLREASFREVARRLLKVSLLRGAHARSVTLFEDLLDRDPDYVLTFDDMAKVGQAYYRTAEFEQATAVYTAIAESSFLREVQIAGTLDGLGELKRSQRFLENLLLSFPALPTMRGALYALAQRLNAKATQLSQQGGPIDERVGSPLELNREARRLCYEFLMRYPDDADADEVLFTLASIALEAEQLDEALELLGNASSAYPDSTWLDDILYIEGYAWFLKGEHEKALAKLRRVAEEDFPIGNGKKGKSPSRWLAVFLQGQIHHAAGKPALALELYKKVQKRYTEAREATDYFKAKRLALPEVSLAGAKEASKFELSWRNLSEVEFTVYKVDLMRLYLLRKSLSDMGKVQLFGIAPIHRQKVTLAEGEDYLDHKRMITLPMKEQGAYLVLARAGELRSSGLLLRSDLKIEVQELDLESRIRVNVKRDGKYLPKALVKVVGEHDGKIRSGKTDLRGIFVADDLQGRATVLVKHGEDYAFYRSKSAFGFATPLTSTKRPSKGRFKAKKNLKQKFDALLMNQRSNALNMQQRGKQLQDLYQNKQRGVELGRTKR